MSKERKSDVTMDEVLGATFDTLSVEKLKSVSDQLFAVESHGVLLQPPTPSRVEAESVYSHCMSTEKCLLSQRGDQRRILDTNAPYLLQGKR